MLTMNMYQKVQLCKKQMLKITEISRKLEIDRKTVRKYYHMTLSEYLEYKRKLEEKSKVFEIYKDEILALMKVNKNVKNSKVYCSSIYDVLEEKYGKLPGGDRTLRNYINFLKRSTDYDNSPGIRLYQDVEDLPYGHQLQLDFGEQRIETGEKVYIFATVLSASRYKYVAVQRRPFRTVDVIEHLLNNFDIIGGIPNEIVIDQDKLMVVSENDGDIILTKAFKDFKEEQGFKLYVCRKADPESKGKVENLVKYVKTSFFSAREFSSFNSIPQRIINWLQRTANGKISKATGCIPSNLIEYEREALNSLRPSIYRKENFIDREKRRVNDKSCISVGSSFYSVPKKYIRKEVWIYKTKSELYIYTAIDGEQIAKHRLSLIPGKTVVDKRHIEDRSIRAITLKEKLKTYIDSELWSKFVEEQYKRYIRYYRNQHTAMSLFISQDLDINLLEEAIDMCFDLNRFSTRNLEETYNYVVGLKQEVVPDIVPQLLKNIKREKSPTIQRRNLSYYTSLISIVGGVL